MTPADISPPEVPSQPTPPLPPPPPNQRAEADTDIASPTSTEEDVPAESESNAEQRFDVEAAVETGLDDIVIAGLGDTPGSTAILDVLAVLNAGVKPRLLSPPFEKGVGTGEGTEKSVTAGTSSAARRLRRQGTPPVRTKGAGKRAPSLREWQRAAHRVGGR